MNTIIGERLPLTADPGFAPFLMPEVPNGWAIVEDQSVTVGELGAMFSSPQGSSRIMLSDLPIEAFLTDGRGLVSIDYSLIGQGVSGAASTVPRPNYWPYGSFETWGELTSRRAPGGRILPTTSFGIVGVDDQFVGVSKFVDDNWKFQNSEARRVEPGPFDLSGLDISLPQDGFAWLSLITGATGSKIPTFEKLSTLLGGRAVDIALVYELTSTGANPCEIYADLNIQEEGRIFVMSADLKHAIHDMMVHLPSKLVPEMSYDLSRALYASRDAGYDIEAIAKYADDAAGFFGVGVGAVARLGWMQGRTPAEIFTNIDPSGDLSKQVYRFTKSASAFTVLGLEQYTPEVLASLALDLVRDLKQNPLTD